ncbi:hypothetical protein [Nocardiopsis chromatogenes]|uniref:hypothetical protein n=1 Tax=Nocardiopsis chromatogenes TaxID=280239 RepID=UPI00034AE5E6|nr:hypothetical protein [Nocardiopsis chromatogenes]
MGSGDTVEATEVLGGVWAGQVESLGGAVPTRRVTLSIVVVDGDRLEVQCASAMADLAAITL